MLVLDPKAWGKLAPTPAGLVSRLSLISHCIDVAAVVRALLELPTVRRRMQSLAGRAVDLADVMRLVALAFLHDVGKASLGFQCKALAAADRLRVLQQVNGKQAQCGHTRIIGPLLHERSLKQRFMACFPLREIVRWQGLDLWMAAISHHGDPITEQRLDDLAHWTWKDAAGYDPWLTLAELGHTARTLFATAWEEAPPLPNSSNFVHAFAGLVSLADWIASNTAPGFFPYTLAPEAERWTVSSVRAREVLGRMSLDIEPSRSDLQQRNPSFGEVFINARSSEPLVPSAVQTHMAELDLGPTVIVEAETGSGKTEAALWRFRTLFAHGLVDALAFVLPTRVAATQLQQRIDRSFKRLFPDPALRPAVVLAVPGYLRVDDINGQRELCSHDVLWADEQEADLAARRWAAEHSKRYLAAACAVGTIDQVLLSGLQVRHSHLRGFCLLRTLLVVDEVHASDTYMTHLLAQVLARHRQAGGHALLLSATLGVRAREFLLHGRQTYVTEDSPDARETAPYPAITDARQSRALDPGKRRKQVQVQSESWLDDAEAIATAAIDAASRGARVLVVRNTVRGVLQVQQALEARLGLDSPLLFRAAGVVCPHHGRYMPADRRILDAAIEDAFGLQARPVEHGRILCGSQTLEQSLDICADLLISDLAPMDVLLQRVGRLHRHDERSRPAGFETPRLIVLMPAQPLDPEVLKRRGGQRHGLGGHVYPNLLSLEATRRELVRDPILDLPAQNRLLVERCTDLSTLKTLADSLGPAWQDHRLELEGRSVAHRTEAHYASLDWQQPWYDCQFPGKEERIRTRLGAEGIRLPLAQPWNTPFGTRIDELVVPAWMWRGDVPEQPLEGHADDGALLVHTSQQSYRYGRLGLEPHTAGAPSHD